METRKNENGDTGINKDNLKPAEAVENWQKDLTEGSIASLWDSLPEDYQGDLNKLASNFGEKMDSEVYNEAMSTIGAAANLIKNKKTIVLAMMKEQAGEDNAEQFAKVEQNYDSIVGLVNAIVTSDAKDIEGMKKLDIGKLLGELQVHTKDLANLTSLAGEDFDKVKDATVALKSESGDTAELTITTDGDAKDVKVVKKDGSWLPAEMIEDWPEMMAEANKGLDEIGKMTSEEKQQAIFIIGMIKSTVKTIEAAESKEEMEEKMKGLMGMFGG